jgi:hypothetical protein
MEEYKQSAELRKALEECAAEGYDVASVMVAGKEYGFRAVTRREWRKLVAERNSKLEKLGDDMARAVEVQEDEIEALIDLCIVYPKVAAEKLLAGVVDTLSTEILTLSGFGGADMEAMRL